MSLECNSEIPVAPGEEHYVLDKSLDEVYFALCRDPRCSPWGTPACRGTFGGRRKAVRAHYLLDFAPLNFSLLNRFGYTGLLSGPLKNQNVGTFHSRASLLDIICMAAFQLSPLQEGLAVTMLLKTRPFLHILSILLYF